MPFVQTLRCSCEKIKGQVEKWHLGAFCFPLLKDTSSVVQSAHTSLSPTRSVLVVTSLIQALRGTHIYICTHVCIHGLSRETHTSIYTIHLYAPHHTQKRQLHVWMPHITHLSPTWCSTDIQRGAQQNTPAVVSYYTYTIKGKKQNKTRRCSELRCMYDFPIKLVLGTTPSAARDWGRHTAPLFPERTEQNVQPRQDAAGARQH